MCSSSSRVVWWARCRSSQCLLGYLRFGDRGESDVRGGLCCASAARHVERRCEQSSQRPLQTPILRSSTSTTAMGSGDRVHWRRRFRARLIHSHLILGSILYLRITTMHFQAIHCTSVLQSDGSYVSLLKIDLTTQCYVGTHLHSSLFVWPMLFVYSVGFPLLCFWLLYRSFHGTALSMAQSRPLPSDPKPSSSSCEPSTSSRFPFPPAARHPHGKPSSGSSISNSSIEMGRQDVTALVPAAGSGNEKRTLVAASQLLSVNQSQPQSKLQSQAMSLFTATATGRQLSRGQSTGTSDEHTTGGAALIEMYATRGLPRTSTDTATGPRSPQHSTATLIPSAAAANDNRHRSPTEVAVALAWTTFSQAQWRAVSESTKELYRQLGKDSERLETFGYVYRQLRGELYYFRLLFFATSFGFAAVSVLPTDPTLRLFLTGVFLVFDLFTTSALLPFETWWRNVLSVAMSWVTVVQLFVMLALVQLGLSTAGSSSVDLGHSSTAQSDSSHLSSALTGDSNAAAQYEIYLGVELIVAMLAVGYVHREKVRAALHRLRQPHRSPTVSTWRLLCGRVSGWAAAMRGGGWSRVTRFDVRPRQLSSDSQRQKQHCRPTVVVADEEALAMVVLEKVQQMRQEEDDEQAAEESGMEGEDSYPGAVEDNSNTPQQSDHAHFSHSRQSTSSSEQRLYLSPFSSTRRLHQPHAAQAESRLSVDSAVAEVEAEAEEATAALQIDIGSGSSGLGAGRVSEPLLSHSLPRLTLPLVDNADSASSDGAQSAPATAIPAAVAAAAANVSTSPRYAISPRHGRTYAVSCQPNGPTSIARYSPRRSPASPASPASRQQPTPLAQSSGALHSPPPLSPLRAAATSSLAAPTPASSSSNSSSSSTSNTGSSSSSTLSPLSSRTRAIRSRAAARATQPVRPNNDGTRVVVTPRAKATGLEMGSARGQLHSTHNRVFSS